MTSRQFEDACRLLRARGASYKAARLVCCDGMSSTAAGKVYGLTPQAVSLAVRRIYARLPWNNGKCPHCGLLIGC